MSILFKVPLEDHPRVCGEQMFSKEETASYKGSPPRVRGTAPAKSFLRLPKRITPACAGNSLQGCVFSAFAQDHPRVCGEQVRGVIDPAQVIGSPPRVRGTVPSSARRVMRPRITPACAGNSNIEHHQNIG